MKVENFVVGTDPEAMLISCLGLLIICSAQAISGRVLLRH